MKQAKPLVLNNGILLQEKEYDATSHLDKSHIIAMNGGSSGPATDLGIIQPFVTAGYKFEPYLYQFNGMGRNRVYVAGDRYTWRHPIQDEPCTIIEDLSNTDKPGIAGEKFRIKVNNNKFDNGYVIAIDQHDPHQLLITEDEIIPSGDGYIITVKLMTYNQNNKWFPKEYLRPNTKFFPITTVESEYSRIGSKIPTITAGMREYFNYMPTAPAQLTYSITRDAAYTHIKDCITASIDQFRQTIEMYIFKPGTIAHDMSMMGQDYTQIVQAYGKQFGSKMYTQMKSDVAMKSWVPKIELLGMRWLELMIEQEAFWGAGGKYTFDGRRAEQRALGLFHQLNKGNVYAYNLGELTIEKFEYIIASRMQHRVNLDDSLDIVIKTGHGGLAVVRNWLRNIHQELGTHLDAKYVIQNLESGNNKNKIINRLEYVGWTMQNGWRIRFERAAGLDPITANDQVNPIVNYSPVIGGGYRLSSYMYIIDDITNSLEGNVIELVKKDSWDFQKRIRNGKLDYYGKKEYIQTHDHPGFEVNMAKEHKAYFLKDPTKSLLIKPYNPVTGRVLYSAYHNK